MTYQAQRPSAAAPAITPLHSLSYLGDAGGLRRVAATDLTPRMPFPIDAGWYEDHWYGERSGSNRHLPGSALRRLRSDVPRAVEICRAIARTLAVLVRRTGASTLGAHRFSRRSVP